MENKPRGRTKGYKLTDEQKDQRRQTSINTWCVIKEKRRGVKVGHPSYTFDQKQARSEQVTKQWGTRKEREGWK